MAAVSQTTLSNAFSFKTTLTGDPLHSRAACTQPCNVNTHSRAHCSPGARLCEQWGHGCVNNGARLCASARLCRGSPVTLSNADDTFKRIFIHKGPVRISIEISLKFVPKGPINNIPGFVQIMAWRRSGDKPLSEPMMVSLLTHICVTRPQ